MFVHVSCSRQQVDISVTKNVWFLIPPDFTTFRCAFRYLNSRKRLPSAEDQLAGTETHGPGFGSQSSDPVKPSELFFNDLSNAAGELECPKHHMSPMTIDNRRWLHRVNVMDVPFYSNSIGTLISSGHKIPDMIQSTPTVNSERSGIQPVNPGHLPVISGYSIVQLQLLACYLQSQRKPDALCLPWYSHVP
ncbi:hypothetical protein V6N11_066334 [Hibiscus sabdariffa]|uniref:Uncharacterized protein n=1 Tax=Hibiscus sabdariffa TaxID=183260 RepID=A0ABR2NF52_9ROSI